MVGAAVSVTTLRRASLESLQGISNGPCAAVTIPHGSTIVAEALRQEVARLHQTEANGSVNAEAALIQRLAAMGGAAQGMPGAMQGGLRPWAMELLRAGYRHWVLPRPVKIGR